MFERIGRFACRHRWWIVAVWATLVLATLPLLPSLERVVKVGGFSAPDSESERATAHLESTLGLSPSSFVIVYSSDSLSVTSAEFNRQVAASLATVRTLDHVQDVVLPSVDESLVAPSGKIAYAIVGWDEEAEVAQRDAAAFEAAMIPQPDVTYIVAGGPAFYADIETASQRDLRRAELIAFPVALAALLLVFGSIIAAAVPLIVGGAGVAVILLAIWAVAHLTDMSIFTLNLATMLGLGLAVDYSLFVTSRFREERRHPGRTLEDAVVRSVATAGRAVFFSGLSVLVGLAGLCIFPLMFLRSVGIAGIIVVGVSTLGALTLLPATLSILGPNLDRFSVPFLTRQTTDDRSEHGFWHGLAVRVMAHPILVVAVTATFLVALGTPFLNANISSPDATILPQDLPSRQGFDLLASEFTGGEISPFVIALHSDDAMTSDENLARLDRLVRKLEADPRIDHVQSAISSPQIPANLSPRNVFRARLALEAAGTDTRLRAFLGPNDAMILAFPVKPANDPDNKALLADLRRLDLGSGMTVLVGGGTASIVDVVDAIARYFVYAAIFVVACTYCILLLLLRSVLLPIKAIVMNVLSILAAYGALVWVFQEGHLSGILRFSPQGFVEASLPVIMFCVLFGLSMDYEVFLLTRIQEEWLRTHDNEHSVAVGLQRSGRIITSAALIVVVVTASFVSADVVLVKALGLGIALAVALDATVVRALLVPATMRLLGNWNWWLPGWLDRRLPRGFHVEH
ncbi:MAG: MMPL family transporter [Thermomicrobiales bacterium]